MSAHFRVSVLRSKGHLCRTEQRMIAHLLKAAIEGGALLFSVDGVFSGINIDDEPPFVSAPKEGAGRSADHIFQGFQPITSCEDVVLEARECGLAGSTWRGLEFVPAPSCLVGLTRKLHSPPTHPRGGHCNPHSLPQPDRLSGAAVGARNDPYVEAISDHQFGTPQH